MEARVDPFAVVLAVAPGSPAANAGLRAGDALVSLAGKEGDSISREKLARRLAKLAARGESATLVVRRPAAHVARAIADASSRIPHGVTGAAHGESRGSDSSPAAAATAAAPLRVDSVTPGSPAATAGLQPGDDIITLDAVLATRETFAATVVRLEVAGAAAPLIVRRAGQTVRLFIAPRTSTQWKGRLGITVAMEKKEEEDDEDEDEGEDEEGAHTGAGGGAVVTVNVLGPSGFSGGSFTPLTISPRASLLWGSRPLGATLCAPDFVRGLVAPRQRAIWHSDTHSFQLRVFIAKGSNDDVKGCSYCGSRLGSSARFFMCGAVGCKFAVCLPCSGAETAAATAAGGGGCGGASDEQCVFFAVEADYAGALAGATAMPQELAARGVTHAEWDDFVRTRLRKLLGFEEHKEGPREQKSCLWKWVSVTLELIVGLIVAGCLFVVFVPFAAIYMLPPVFCIFEHSERESARRKDNELRNWQGDFNERVLLRRGVFVKTQGTMASVLRESKDSDGNTMYTKETHWKRWLAFALSERAAASLRAAPHNLGGNVAHGVFMKWSDDELCLHQSDYGFENAFGAAEHF